MRAQQLFDVSGAVAFITGAANGLGLAMAEVMAANGARVVMADINETRLREQAKRLAQNVAPGAQVEAVVVDVTDAARLKEAIDQAAAVHGGIDVVFANAGVSIGPGFLAPAGHIENASRPDWDRVIDINLNSVFTTLQCVVPHMKRKGSGSIIVTGSIGGLRSEPIIGYSYIAAKSAVTGIVRQAALELAPFGIRINAIAPGPFLTNINNGRLANEEVASLFASHTPMNRLADPDEIKGVALLLASKASSYMTGTVVSVDGGMIAR
ncbi:SDR family NAD(P)-dependent oxidoreductase [Noviherbaspirillum pedocola]|uniref:SDR family oxidoreductase n=1 Tax=Noviherbaspirillum pedocola TaxID=2801341 RepID=A0A934SXZ3_9BURK|nr:SDR family NAD(P)-dependent oxidoreductase [Noviherbaspirillum pedocola]MBK4737390.1 SDR family oxidoreductase [Noviherbaspirillum pedocola]